jgi:hypothetical protein
MDQFIEKARKRGLAILGIFLLLVAVEGLVRNEITMVGEAPQLGTIVQLPKDQSSGLPEILVKLNNMPFLMTGIVGGFFIIWDINKYMKEKSVFKQ